MAYDANGKGRAQLVHGTILVPALGQPDVTPGAELEGECAMALYLIMYGDAESISFETNEIDVERLQSTLYGLLRRSWDADNRRIEFQDDERQVHRYRPDAWASARAYLVDDDEKDHHVDHYHVDDDHVDHDQVPFCQKQNFFSLLFSLSMRIS